MVRNTMELHLKCVTDVTSQYSEYDNIAFVGIDFQKLSQHEINLLDGHVAERLVHGI
jgi:hypothetical protein